MFLAHGWTRIFSLNTNRSNVTNIFGTRTDTDFFFEHESLEWKANIFGTRMDGHGFTMRMITLFILPQMSDGHRFGIFKVALTKTIKTPNSIFRKPLALHCLL